MFTWWSNRVVRSRKPVIAAAIVFMVFAGIWGTGVFGSLVDGGFDDPNNESSRAAAVLAKDIGRSDADLIVLVDIGDQTVDDPAYATAVDNAVDTLPSGVVKDASTYWSTTSPTFVSKDRHTTIALITLNSPDSVDDAQIDGVRQSLTDAGYDAKVGGPVAVNREISSRVGSDLALAETISMPILLLLLIVIFGSVVAASLPLLIGGISILGSFTALRVLTEFTDVSIFAANLVTILGLGLAIDYGLLIVGRYREERESGRSVQEAVSRTVQTAGRTVAISALTVAVALSGLLLFPQTFLKSMGYGGIAAVLIAAIAAVGVLPAVLAALGDRIEKWTVRKRAATPALDDESGFWYRLAHSVMRRPGRYLIAAVALLAILTVPFLGVKFGGVDERVLPTDSESRQVTDALADDFGINPGAPILLAVTLDEDVTSTEGEAALSSYVTSVRALDGVNDAQVVGASGTTARIDVSYTGEALDDSAKDVVTELRGGQLPAGVQGVLVGGQTAALIDRLDSIGSTLPWMALLVGLATFVLLFLAFGSVLLPIKAILLNVLSLGASLGVVTWIFQGGHLSGLLGFTPTGFVEATQPILVVAIVFGLSMDYEVFLLSRIREQYDLTGDNTKAVAAGMQRTGRIITAAALLIIVVIGAFSTSSIAFIKLIGIAMLTAIIIDALLVRMIVVPAVMRLMGNANWWAPKFLRPVYARFGFKEDGPGETHLPPAPPVTPERQLANV